MATTTIDIERMLPATLTFPDMSEQEFLDLCGRFPDATLEYEPDGTLLIMPPTDPESGMRSVAIVRQLANWSEQTGKGLVLGPDAGFFFPNGARRSPDASWFDEKRWREVLAHAKGSRFPRFAPEFVIELRSPDDRLPVLNSKMREYMANGVQLAWQIDPQNRTVTVYRAGSEPTTLSNPTEVIGEGPVAGFVLSMAKVF